MRQPFEFTIHRLSSTRVACSNIMLAASMLILCWLILTRTFGAYIASAAPHAAHLLALPSAAANPALAEPTLKSDERTHTPLSAEHKARIRDRATKALTLEPLDARALEMLGLVAIEEHNIARADRLMSAATERSRRRTLAQYWLLQRKRETRQYGEAVNAADSLLRARPQSMPLVSSELAKMSETAGAQSAIRRLLSDNPPWRAAFFTYLRGRIRNPRTPLRLLLSLKDTPHPPTETEIRACLDLLIRSKLYKLAYYSWLQLLPLARLGKARAIYNGDFTIPLSRLPFDWNIQSSDNAEIEIAPRDDRSTENALSITFGSGRIDFPPVSQMLVLDPGIYTLSGLFKGEIDGARGLRWKIQCIEQLTAPNQTEMFIGTVAQWTKFTADISIPAGCDAQILTLFLDSRSASETIVSGSARFANLAISRH